MKNKVLSTLTLLALTGAMSTQAEVYIGATGGIASHNYSDVDDSTSNKFFIGYQIPDSIIGLEVAVVDLGTADVDGTDAEIEIDGNQIAFVFSTNTLADSTGNLYLKLGMYSLDTSVTWPSLSFSETEGSNGLMWGLGGHLVLTKGLSLVGEISGYHDVSYIFEEEIATSMDIGLQYNF